MVWENRIVLETRQTIRKAADRFVKDFAETLALFFKAKTLGALRLFVQEKRQNIPRQGVSDSDSSRHAAAYHDGARAFSSERNFPPKRAEKEIISETLSKIMIDCKSYF